MVPIGHAGGEAGDAVLGRNARVTSREALATQQLKELRRLLSEVGATNPFYRQRWDAGGAHWQPDSLDEFRRTMPFTRKHELVADQAQHPPYGTNLTFPLERYTRCHGTSGSTGRPLRWLDTPESWAWMLGHWRRVFEAAGVGAGDRVFFAFSFGPFLGFWTAFEAALGMGCLCLPGGGLTSLARVRSLLEQEATVLCCTPTYALHLADVAAGEHIDLGASRVRNLFVAGEPGGSLPSVRRALEARWPGAVVRDHHGMTEVGPVSYECPAEPGVLHPIETSYLVEVVDTHSGAEVADGETGELVLTTLGRVGSPLIRYRTGDLVRKRPGEGRCGCGTWDQAWPGGILGRTDDMVVIRGVNVYPSAVEEVVREVGGAGEYRAEVHAMGAMLELRLVVEPDRGRSELGETLARRLEAAFQSRLALRVPVRVVEAGSLPRFEMKSRRWIRTASPGEAV